MVRVSAVAKAATATALLVAAVVGLNTIGSERGLRLLRGVGARRLDVPAALTEQQLGTQTSDACQEMACAPTSATATSASRMRTASAAPTAACGTTGTAPAGTAHDS
eukprot:CAMPEP_0183445288 /NCGR_PEP_ID=MMETSP0370-20130417/96226_1 /TAXON_ID=268820 /ORGANISM="Peridinium aciculiferum, Strain PAER-2" /LENGTH=106 /DNA_ID=CAMNT_0025635835 /DNA_START=42 /DNA_END=360 /DNA_ORIENTATION=+